MTEAMKDNSGSVVRFDIKQQRIKSNREKLERDETIAAISAFGIEATTATNMIKGYETSEDPDIKEAAANMLGHIQTALLADILPPPNKPAS